MVGMHYPELLLLMSGCAIVPFIVALVWIRPDANRRGQPGALWAFLALPLGWIAVLAYVVVRAIAPAREQ